jgi:alcohol dehydrogenase
VRNDESRAIAAPAKGTPTEEPWRAVLRPARVIYGAGSLASLGDEARGLGAERVLVVTDPGIAAAGHVERARASFDAADLEVFVFDGVEENPGEEHVEAGTEVARERRVDLLVGLGGGSAMDCAKGINFLLTNGGRMQDYWGFGKASRPMLPSIGVPCTAGTGSEAQSYALIARRSDHRKMACGDEKARFRTVILDPELARTAPREVRATAGIDAVSHALESYVSTARNAFSQIFAAEAWRRLESRLTVVAAGDADLGDWGEMLLGAHLAGAAIETSMLGAAHACANPLTARFGTTHGEAVGVMLPHVVRFNAATVGSLYGELAGGGAATAGESVAARVAELLESTGLKRCLRDLGVERQALPELSRAAAEQWTARFNPRPVAEADLLGLYETAF